MIVREDPWFCFVHGQFQLGLIQFVKVRLVTRFALLMAVLSNVFAEPNCVNSQPSWSVDVAQYGLRPFGAKSLSTWEKQQGIVFLGEDVVAAFQVSRSADVPKVASRNQEDASAEYWLDVLFFSAADGKLLHKLHLPTNAGESGVFPLRSGRFLIRTGLLLQVYDSSFTKMATTTLPHQSDARDHWAVTVAADKQQVFADYTLSLGRLGFQTKAFVLDATTLKTVTSFEHNGMSLWLKGDSTFFGSKESGAMIGTFTPESGWRDLYNAEWPSTDRCERHSTFVTSHVYLARYGCNELRVRDSAGTIFSLDVKRNESFNTIVASEKYIAAEVSPRCSYLFDTGCRPRAKNVVIADLQTKSACALRVQEPLSIARTATLYAVSDAGEIATGQRGRLTFFRQPTGK